MLKSLSYGCIIFFCWIGYIYPAFSSIYKDYFVVENKTKLCGLFSPGTNETPNWLPPGWEVIHKKSEDVSTDAFCKSQGLRYAGVKIGTPLISEQRRASEFLASKNIILSHFLKPSGYQSERGITRKEAIKIIMKMSTYNHDDQKLCYSSFSDIDNSDWACKYIESALDRGYITAQSFFRPDDTLSQTEALKLIFAARSISKKYQTNSWQQDYISSALYLSLIDEKYSDYNTPATRGWFFIASARSYSDYNDY